MHNLLRSVYLLSAFWSVFVISVQAQDESYWTEGLGPYGSDGELTLTSTGALYSVSRAYQVYKSSDNGQNWVRLPNPIQDTAALVKARIQVGQAGNLYKVLRYSDSTTGIFRSHNDGETWVKVHQSDSILQIVEQTNGVLIGRNNQHLYRSLNAGLTWFKVYHNSTNKTIDGLIIGNNGDLWAALGWDRLLRSKNNGMTWTEITAPQSSNSWLSSLYVAKNGAILLNSISGGYRSVNEGLTFQPIPKIDTSYATQWVSLCVLNTGRILYVNASNSANTNFYYSDDHGLTWHQKDTPFYLRDIFPFQLPDGTIFAKRYPGLFRSNDEGQGWTFSSTGIRNYHGPIQYASADTIYAGDYGMLWRTFDAGQQWESVASDTLDTWRLMKVLDRNNFVAAHQKGLFLSQDRGETYSGITPPGFDFGRTGFDAHPTDHTFFVGTASGTFRSADMGNSWAVVNADMRFGRMAFAGGGKIYAAMQSVLQNFGVRLTLWESNDNGDTWVLIPTPDEIYTFVLQPDGSIIILTVYSKMFRRAGNGADWIPVATVDGVSNGATHQALFNNSQGGLFFLRWSTSPLMSVDAANSWQSLPAMSSYLGLGANKGTTLGGMTADGHLFVLVDGAGLLVSRHSTLNGVYLTGHVLGDIDGECATPDAQAPLDKWILEAQRGHDRYFTTSDATGRYLFFLDTGMYQLRVAPPNTLWWSVCDSTQSVQLNVPGQTQTLDIAGVALAECPLMTVDLGIPRLRRCFDNSVYVHYCNQGSEMAEDAWIDLVLDPYLVLVTSAQPYDTLDVNTYRFSVGHVGPGQCGSFEIRVYVDCDAVLGQTHCISSHAYPDTLCFNVPGWSGAELNAYASCQDSIVRLELRNESTVPTQLLDYIIFEDDVVLMTGDHQFTPGEALQINFPANGRTWRIQSEQESSHPFSTMALAFVEGCGGYNSLGFVNQFPVDAYRPSWDRDCLQNTGSYDPNDKQGFPLGRGTAHRIRAGQELEYLVRFQNTGTDTAFTVVIRDTLSAWLDPATVRPGVSSHPYTWELSGQGVLIFTFNNILLPDSNTNEAASHGFIQFRMEQQHDVPFGAAIFNEAAIYFDFNPPIFTNRSLHTVGDDYTVRTQTPVATARAAQVLVAPNPMRQRAALYLETGVFDQHQITIVDVRGQVVRQARVSAAQYWFERGGLPNGLYFFRVEDSRGTPVGSGRILLTE